MSHEAAFLSQLAERPFDQALRLAFADWLLEQDDPRGEVIALSERGGLALTERRKVARTTALFGRRWLGPLDAIADPHRTRFIGGFLDELVCSGGLPDAVWSRLQGEPRLATVRSLALPPSQAAASLGGFLSSPVLRSLARLELGATDWRALSALRTLQLQKAVVASWGVFHRELQGLRDVPGFAAAASLGLSSTEFINAQVVPHIVQHVREQHAAVSGFHEVQLLCRYGVLEGAAAWLLAAEQATTLLLPSVERWGVEVGEVAFSRVRDESGAFRSLTIDLSLPEATIGEKEAVDAVSSLERRFAVAAGVLVQLAPARLRSVLIKLTPGTRLRATERNALKSAARRSGLLETFVIEGEARLDSI